MALLVFSQSNYIQRYYLQKLLILEMVSFWKQARGKSMIILLFAPLYSIR